MGIRSLDDLQNGFDNKLGEDDLRLFGGQRQRVAIAWTLLKNIDLPILDVMMGNLDSYLEKHVHSGTETMERDCVTSIARRLSTVTNANLIHVMGDRKIREVVTEPGLIQQKGKYEDCTATIGNNLTVFIDVN